MGDRSVAKVIDVQLDRFQLDHSRSWLLNQAHHCEIRITRERTEASKFRQFDRHLIGAPDPWVVETDQLRICNSPFAVQRSFGELSAGVAHKTSKKIQRSTLKPTLQKR